MGLQAKDYQSMLERKGLTAKKPLTIFTIQMAGWGSALRNGRSGGIRTHDPHTPSVVRYQAALRSDRTNCRRTIGMGRKLRNGRRVIRPEVSAMRPAGLPIHGGWNAVPTVLRD